MKSKLFGCSIDGSGAFGDLKEKQQGREGGDTGPDLTIYPLSDFLLQSLSQFPIGNTNQKLEGKGRAGNMGDE